MTVKGDAPPNDVRRSEAVELDAIDRHILQILSSDARIPNNALATRVGIAPSTCLGRVRRLEDLGVIQGYHAVLAPAALGKPLQAIVSVRLQAHARARIGAFAEQFATLPGVLNVYFLAGGTDFQIHVAASSADELRDFVVRSLNASKDVVTTETSLIFEHVTGRGLVPEPERPDRRRS